MINRFNHPSLSSTSLLHKSIPEIYCSCGIYIIPTAEDTGVTSTSTPGTSTSAANASSSSIVATQTSQSKPKATARLSPSSPSSPSSSPSFLSSCQTTAYFRDTKSKRAKVVIPVLLSFENEFERKAVIRSGAIQPIPMSTPAPAPASASSSTTSTNTKNTNTINDSDSASASASASDAQTTAATTTESQITSHDEAEVETQTEASAGTVGGGFSETAPNKERYGGGLDPDPLGGLDGLGSFGGSGSMGGTVPSAGAGAGANGSSTRTSSGWDSWGVGGDVSLGDGSELWSSELDTLGEARGGSQDGSSSEKLELKFECFSFVRGDNNGSVSGGVSGGGCGNEGEQKNDNVNENDDTKNDTVEEVVIIEGVTILSTSMVDTADTVGIRFDVEIAVRCPSHATPSSAIDVNVNRTNLNIKSVLVCTSSKPTDDERNFFDSKRSFSSNSFMSNTTNGNSYLDGGQYEEAFDNIFLAKQALDMGVNCISPYESESNLPTSSYFARSLSYALPSGGCGGNGVYSDDDDNGNDEGKNTDDHNSDTNDQGLHVKLTLVPATTIHVREVSGASSNAGVTLVSLLICHSNLHNEDVTITNIALHPGHSRLLHSISVGFSGVGFGSGGDTTSIANSAANTAISMEGPTMPGGETAVMNMIKHVRWGYAKGTSPSMPFTLAPQEAVATVIQINASEDSASRTFVSPICVRGVVGRALGRGGTCTSTGGNRVNSNSDISGSGDGVADTYRDEYGNNTSMIMDSVDARWTTSRVVLGKADAFRINLSLQETQCNVGAQVLVSLKVMNLSDEPRNLMLLMAKEEHPSDNDGHNDVGEGNGMDEKAYYDSRFNNDNNAMSYAGGTIKGGISSVGSDDEEKSDVSTALGINNAIVYEVNGYTFGVWGLSGEDDGTVRYNRDHELLAVDAALLLGEVKGQHSIDAELRFVPLREGILKVPNLKLYDKYSGSWYDCVHTLQIITAPSQ